jgi:hypothetical protein
MREALSLAKRKSYTRLSERKYRTESGLFLAEGERTVMQLLSNLPSPDFLEALIIRETSPESLRGALQPNSRFHLEDIPKHFHPKIYWAKKEEFDLIATTEEPFAQVNECAFLKVTDIGKFGVFMDWGLTKDLFVPFKEQIKPMQVGQYYSVYVYMYRSNI